MKWLIFFIMIEADSFAVKSLEFETKYQCLDYVNNPANSSRLAIEVIDHAGFNDEIVSVGCISKKDLKKLETKV